MKKKFLILFMLFSLAAHALVIALSLRIDMPAVTQNDKVMKIDLKTLKDTETPRIARKEKPALPSPGAYPEGALTREASVGLENPGGPYEAYLLLLRGKIERFWTYPPRALAENREGSAVIRFTIAANGALAGSSVISSSGSTLLDEGALACIKAASPFEPLPPSFNLSLLNVTATFSYRITI